VSGAVAVVVFRTEAYRGTGFRLSFSGVGNFLYDFANWDDIVYSQVPGFITYPADDDGDNTYEFNTLSIFVVTKDHRQITNSKESLHINMIDVSLDPTCCQCDYLRVFSFMGDNLEPLDKYVFLFKHMLFD